MYVYYNLSFTNRLRRSSGWPMLSNVAISFLTLSLLLYCLKIPTESSLPKISGVVKQDSFSLQTSYADHLLVLSFRRDFISRFEPRQVQPSSLLGSFDKGTPHEPLATLERDPRSCVSWCQLNRRCCTLPAVGDRFEVRSYCDVE